MIPLTMNLKTDPEDILYGDYPRHIASEDWRPAELDVSALYLDDDGYFSFSGFSGCSEWMAKTDALPESWLSRSHYSPQNERSAEGLLERLHVKDQPAFKGLTSAAWIHADEDDADVAVIETEEHRHRSSVHKLAAIELLSQADGEWRIHPYAADPEHPLLLYIGADDQLLGLIRI